MSDFQVTLMGCTPHPQTTSVAGALGCFEEKSSLEILEELQALPFEERLKKERGVLKNSYGRGHGSIADQNCFIFSIEDLPRLATIQLCLPEYLAHLQQSLRRATASRGFYLPEAIKESSLAKEVNETLNQSFTLYEDMVAGGIPKEDARFLLPLYTRTNIQTAGNARELTHLLSMSQGKHVPSIVRRVIGSIIEQAKEKAPALFENFGTNYEQLAWLPSSQIFYLPTDKGMATLIERAHGESVFLVDKAIEFPLTESMMEKAIESRDETVLAGLKHIHFEFLCAMSLACYHQAIRQRTWNHFSESIYTAAVAHPMVLPPSIGNSTFYAAYKEQHNRMIELYGALKDVAIQEVIGVIPHSVRIYTLVHINGWNALHAIGKRTCTAAQWEIRGIAQAMAQIIKEQLPVLGKWAEPQCITYGHCPEAEDCGYYKKQRK